MLSQMLTSLPLGLPGETRPLMPEVGAQLELAMGHLLARCRLGQHAVRFPSEPGLPGEPGALSWEPVRIVNLPTW